MRRFLVVLISMLALSDPMAAQTAETAAYASLIAALERALLTGDSAAYLSLASATADRDAAAAFGRENLHPDIDRATVSPRFRVPIEDLPADMGYELTVEVFSESEVRGRLETWQLEIVREGDDGSWRIRDQTHVDSIDNLHHLGLTSTKQYAADNLVVLSEDLSIDADRVGIRRRDGVRGDRARVAGSRDDALHPATGGGAGSGSDL